MVTNVVTNVVINVVTKPSSFIKMVYQKCTQPPLAPSERAGKVSAEGTNDARERAKGEVLPWQRELSIGHLRCK